MDLTGTFNKTHATLLNAQHVLLIPHRYPDSDSLGGALVFYEWLEQANIKATMYCATEINPNISFLPGYNLVSESIPDNIDTVCVFDSGDAQFAYLPEILSRFKKRPTVISIDHHVSNDMYGDINLVVPTCPSTTALSYQFFKHHNIHITHTMATNMLAGLVTDTGIFSNPATNIEAIEIGADLMNAGARIENVVSSLMRIKPIGAFKLWGRALSRIEKHPTHDIAYTVITQKDHEDCHVTKNDIAGLANFLNSVADCAVTLILKETEEGNIKGSLRTTRKNIDVSKFATALGGGGHAKAAGFTIPGKIKETNSGWQIV